MAHSESHLTIALAGNPNCGKTTIFNAITGTRQKTGNWPGVTVEKKEGRIKKYGYELTIVDLPGIYSLTPFSIEEIVARDFLLDETPDVVINIIDATNMERSLYLATQLREIDCKVIFALNMADVVQRQGIKIDAAKMAELLDVPVVFTVGNRNDGIDTLLEKAIALAGRAAPLDQKRRVQYSHDIEAAIGEMIPLIESLPPASLHYNVRWTAIKLLEGDPVLEERLGERVPELAPNLIATAGRHRDMLCERYNDELEIVMTDERYGFIAGIIKETLRQSVRKRVDVSRSIDRVLTNRYLGFPIFIFFIWAMFQLTFTLGDYPMGWLETGIDAVAGVLAALIPDGLVKDLIIDGVVAGVGSVIVFLPNILILFFCIALFEDTGYMARAAFLMDRIMHLIGLHGKSFIPMLMGFGCNVPAIMAARTLESEKDRILTILITPFMSCSAKLPVYIVLAGTFFGGRAATVIFGIYVIGIAMSVLTGRLFRSTLLRGSDAPFVMELPPYRAPMARSLVIHMWDRSKLFLKKMGGVILVGAIVVWALSAFPRNAVLDQRYDVDVARINAAFADRMAAAPADQQADLENRRQAEVQARRRQLVAAQTEYSAMGHLGKVLTPVVAPLGIDWRGGVALLSGFVAKEIVVSTLGVLHSVDVQDDDGQHALAEALRNSGMTAAGALAMMVFVLLYVPCLATVSAIRRETGSIRWTLLSVGYSTGLAWLAAFVAFHGSQWLGVA